MEQKLQPHIILMCSRGFSLPLWSFFFGFVLLPLNNPNNAMMNELDGLPANPCFMFEEVVIVDYSILSSYFFSKKNSCCRYSLEEALLAEHVIFYSSRNMERTNPLIKVVQNLYRM